MILKFHTLAIRGAEEASILLHSKTLVNLLVLLREHDVYETILEDTDGTLSNTLDIEDFVSQYNSIEDAQFELRLYTDQSITY